MRLFIADFLPFFSGFSLSTRNGVGVTSISRLVCTVMRLDIGALP